MAKSINTFAVILLAFPFYLAQKGRLAAYINLAKPSQGSASANVATTTAVSSPAPVPASSDTATASSSSSQAVSMAGTADALSTVLTDASALFT